MSDNTIIVTTVIIILSVHSFLAGYLLGLHKKSNSITDTKNLSFFKQQNSQTKIKNTIDIDDKKFVIDIKTDGLEKKYDSLGDIKKSEENISTSVDKLKKLKS